MTRLLQLDAVSKLYRPHRRLPWRRERPVHAVDRVSLTVDRGEILGLVGESGSGKTTLGRMILRLTDPSSGRIRFLGDDLTTMNRRQLFPYRRRMQIVFQDPSGSMNPRRSVEHMLAEPLRVHRWPGSHQARIRELLQLVGMDPAVTSRYPHEFSGGQRQRLAIARAIALDPDLVVADEPVSALDVSVQAQILGLINRLCRDRGIAFVFISHDLAVVAHLCHRVAVMHGGRIVECGHRDTIFHQTGHPYTQALIECRRRGRTPLPPAHWERARGEPHRRPYGCTFVDRCPRAEARCSTITPELLGEAGGHQVRCHLFRFGKDPAGGR